jgi:hypothetical protein
MGTVITNLLWVLLGLAAILAAVHLLRRYRRSRRRASEGGTEVDEPRCANCGYPMKGLEIPRCPECGALQGFKKPLDELGLTEQEVREGFARRRRERERKNEEYKETR